MTETVAWASGEVSGVLTRDGAVVALPRLGWGLTGTGSQPFTQDSPGCPAAAGRPVGGYLADEHGRDSPHPCA